MRKNVLLLLIVVLALFVTSCSAYITILQNSMTRKFAKEYSMGKLEKVTKKYYGHCDHYGYVKDVALFTENQLSDPLFDSGYPAFFIIDKEGRVVDSREKDESEYFYVADDLCPSGFREKVIDIRKDSYVRYMAEFPPVVNEILGNVEYWSEPFDLSAEPDYDFVLFVFTLPTIRVARMPVDDMVNIAKTNPDFKYKTVFVCSNFHK